MKKLVTDRLILRAFKDTDLDAFYEYCKNPKIGPSAGWKPHENINESKHILRRFIKNEEIWAVVLKEGGKLLGSIGLHEGDSYRPNVKGVFNLGYVLDSKYWGRGYMYEACKEVIRYAFEELRADMLTVRHYTFNNQSKRVIEKCGFTYEGTLRKASVRQYDGKILDSAVYSMVPAEFSVNRKVNHSEDWEQDEEFSVVKMSTENAYACLEWKYLGAMSVYNCPINNYEQAVNDIIEKSNGLEYYAVYDSFGTFFGLYNYMYIDGILQVGFRINPTKMGRGYTKSFVMQSIQFAREKFNYTGEVTIKIAAANTRGIGIIKNHGGEVISNTTEEYNTVLINFVTLSLKSEG